MKKKIISLALVMIISFSVLLTGCDWFSPKHKNDNNNQTTIVKLNDDRTNPYYYVEMGTYNNKPVRWRYVGNGTNYTFKTLEDPDSILNNNDEESAYFIQETLTLPANLKEWFSTMITENPSSEQYKQASNKLLQYVQNKGNVYSICTYKINDGTNQGDANIYSTSTVRQYVNSTNPTFHMFNNMGIKTTLLEDLLIKTDTDEIYTKIKSRNLETTHDVNKIFIPSIDELKTMFNITDATNENQTSKLIWNDLPYWTRTPSISNNQAVQAILQNGNIITESSVSSIYLARPAFKI